MVDMRYVVMCIDNRTSTLYWVSPPRCQAISTLSIQSLAVYQYGGGRPGKFYHVSDRGGCGTTTRMQFARAPRAEQQAVVYAASIYAIIRTLNKSFCVQPLERPYQWDVVLAT